MRYLFVILSVLLLSSCISYRVQTRQPELRTVLGVTTQGDTIQVPMDYFQDRTPRYNYDIEYFFWRDNWWLYNQNLYNRWWWDYQPYWRPRPNHIIIPRYTPQRQPQRVTVPRQRQRRTPQVQPNRGRSNQTIRQPQYNRPQTTTRPSNPTRRSVPTRSNSTTRSRNGNQ